MSSTLATADHPLAPRIPFNGIEYTDGRLALFAAYDAGRFNVQCPENASRDFRAGWRAGEQTWGVDFDAEARRAERNFGC